MTKLTVDVRHGEQNIASSLEIGSDSIIGAIGQVNSVEVIDNDDNVVPATISNISKLVGRDCITLEAIVKDRGKVVIEIDRQRGIVLVCSDQSGMVNDLRFRLDITQEKPVEE